MSTVRDYQQRKRRRSSKGKAAKKSEGPAEKKAKIEVKEESKETDFRTYAAENKGAVVYTEAFVDKDLKCVLHKGGLGASAQVTHHCLSRGAVDNLDIYLDAPMHPTLDLGQSTLCLSCFIGQYMTVADLYAEKQRRTSVQDFCKVMKYLVEHPERHPAWRTGLISLLSTAEGGGSLTRLVIPGGGGKALVKKHSDLNGEAWVVE